MENMNEQVGDNGSTELNNAEIEYLVKQNYKMVYSERLGRNVFQLKDWVDKSVFKRHKKLFGYTDIGWTVKHPKQLIRALISEGIWVLAPEIRLEIAAAESQEDITNEEPKED